MAAPDPAKDAAPAEARGLLRAVDVAMLGTLRREDGGPNVSLVLLGLGIGSLVAALVLALLGVAGWLDTARRDPLFAALVVLPELGWTEALLLAAILAPTDAALGQAVVSNPLVPVRIRQLGFIQLLVSYLSEFTVSLVCEKLNIITIAFLKGTRV